MKKNLFFFKSSFHFLSFLQKTQTQKTGPNCLAFIFFSKFMEKIFGFPYSQEKKEIEKKGFIIFFPNFFFL